MDRLRSVCEILESGERGNRVQALRDLQDFCEIKTNLAKVLAAFNECYLHILRCYSDRYESVRYEAVLTVTLYIQNLPPTDFHLLNVISALIERMGNQETVENSEELRLVYISQLKAIIQVYVNFEYGQSLEASYSDISKILKKALCDTFPSVQQTACSCIDILSSAANSVAFQQYAELLIKPLYSMLSHKHSKCRIGAISAISKLALHVDPTTNALPQLFTAVSPLLMDSLPPVRRECGLMGVMMLLELKDRYSYIDRIIPLVLCCLKDDSPYVCEHIFPLWLKCGLQYYFENETELSRQELVDLKVENYPEDVQRPHIGCRALVQRSLRLLKLIIRESLDWKENVRIHSLKLLYQFVLHAEAAMTAKFFEIYPGLAQACCDNQTAVAAEAVKVADLMGRLFSYEDWFPHGYGLLSQNANIGYLKCFYYMLSATMVAKNEDMIKISCLLIEPAFSQDLKPNFQIYVIKLIQTLLEKCKYFKNEIIYKNLYVATIKVMALSLDQNVSNIQQTCLNVLETIAQYKNVEISDLHSEYFAKAVEYVNSTDTPLDGLSEQILLLRGLISICKLRAPYIEVLQIKINEVWQNCADDAKVKIFSTLSIAMLYWHETISVEVKESTQMLLGFVHSVVEKHLFWKAGSNADTMRSIGTAILCAISQGPQLEAKEVLPKLAKFLPNLIEDQSVATRKYALRCLNNFGELTVKELKPIAYATIQRIDDPSENIRELAVSVIPKLSPKFEDNNSNEDCDDYQIWKQFISRALEVLFLHFEGPEIRLKIVIKASLLQLAVKYMNVFKELYERANAMAYDNSSLTELRNDLPFEI